MKKSLLRPQSVSPVKSMPALSPGSSARVRMAESSFQWQLFLVS
jgi:hypothetical protein